MTCPQIVDSFLSYRINRTGENDMKITERDMERPDYWKTFRTAELAVHTATGFRLMEAPTDKQARAVDDAALALTKALLLLKGAAA